MVIFKDGPLEDNARRAVEAAIEIVLANKQLNEGASWPWGETRLHLGINSGSAWVGSTKMRSLWGERWTYTASGMVTLLAARIGQLSSDTRLYVGPETHRHVEDSFNCQSLGPQQVKNVEEPVSVYWVVDYKEAPRSNDS